MKDKVLNFIELNGKVKKSKLENIFKTNLDDILNELESEGLIFVNGDDIYDFKETGYVKGTINMNSKGFAFLINDIYDDIYINKKDTGDAIEGDIVYVSFINKNELRAKVVKVIKRNKDYLVGMVFIKDDIYYVKPDNKDYLFNVLLSHHDTNNLVDGSKVLIKLGDLISKDLYKGSVLKLLGHKDDPLVDVLSIAYDHGFSLDFTPEAQEEIDNIPSTVREKDLVGRRDLTGDNCFTIDGSDTKDIDDAVSIKIIDNNYVLYVHIADVTYYFPKDGALDVDARNRSTSVYLTNYVIPMLPRKLSNGICSLNPNEVRLTITAELTFDKEGNLLKSDVYPSFIKSKCKMNYDEVNSLLEGKEISSNIKPFANDLLLMNELASKLRRNKMKRGFINFPSTEIKVIVDEEGFPIDFKKEENKLGENMIEDFMIAANEAVARLLEDTLAPSIYRIHGKPKEDRVKAFQTFVHSLGLNDLSKKNLSRPSDVQKVLDMVKDREDFDIIAEMLLRTMQKAVYSTSNIGHFGIASKSYTHFTAPIRRYPDELVHRLLRRYIFNKDFSDLKKLENVLKEDAVYSSKREEEAVKCERETNDMKMAEYMEKHIGDVFDAKVCGIQNFGMFVRLPNYIEGLVSSDNMNGKFKYIEKEESYASKNKKYNLGDKVKVKVINASKEKRTIDLALVD